MIDKQYKILSDYALLNNNGLSRILDIQERYEKFRHYLNKDSSLPIINRIKNVICACDEIQEDMFREAEWETKFQEMLGEGKYKEIILPRRKEEIDRAKEIYPPFEKENQPLIQEAYKKYGAKKLKQKISAMEKALGEKPGKCRVHSPGDWREDKSKQKQFKLRVLIEIYLSQRGD